eukprot:1155396-Amorphochlora_amoeboformis.AAC.1
MLPTYSSFICIMCICGSERNVLKRRAGKQARPKQSRAGLVAMLRFRVRVRVKVRVRVPAETVRFWVGSEFTDEATWSLTSKAIEDKPEGIRTTVLLSGL